MPTITIEVPRKLMDKDLRIDITTLPEQEALLLLSTILEIALQPSEKFIRELAEHLEAKAWEAAKRSL